MTERRSRVHPYIPNSAPESEKKMLELIGVRDVEELFSCIPESLRFTGEMNLPEALTSERELSRHMERLLRRNGSCLEHLSFLGAGCWEHHVPAVCDEVIGRAEFLTAYAGEPYEDHGRFQALFEYASLMGELLEMDVVSVPTYDWAGAAAMAVRMAGRIADRGEVLVPETISPDRLTVMTNYISPVMSVRQVCCEESTGQMDLDDLGDAISDDTAAVYFENPSYLGLIEDRGGEISAAAHDAGAVSVVGVDPSSLGVLIPPIRYGADIVCGELQPLGVHMNYGGGLAGFIASRDEVEFVQEYPLRLFGLTSTEVEGEYGFGDVFYERTSFARREGGKDFVGTMTALWGIAAGVYLALMGPEGMVELGTTIMQRSQYAAAALSSIDGVRAPRFDSAFFKEFVVDFNETGRTVRDINQMLLDEGIFGGRDLSVEFPALGQCALYSVTEVHSRADLDRLAEAVRRCVG
ncbi:MAG: aminomethyl-transferring glycine dehydrogenase subunit GcvPA [Bacillota bacterium]